MKKYIWLIFVVVMCAGGPLNLLKILAIATVPLLLWTWFIVKIYDGEWWIRLQAWCNRPEGGVAQITYYRFVVENLQSYRAVKAEEKAKKEARKRKWHLFWIIRRAIKRRRAIEKKLNKRQI